MQTIEIAVFEPFTAQNKENLASQIKILDEGVPKVF
jgi:hypothetical protein